MINRKRFIFHRLFLHFSDETIPTGIKHLEELFLAILSIQYYHSVNVLVCREL